MAWEGYSKDVQDLQDKPIIIIEDNQGAIEINPVTHSKTKHIDIIYHHTREAVRDGTVILSYWVLPWDGNWFKHQHNN